MIGIDILARLANPDRAMLVKPGPITSISIIDLPEHHRVTDEERAERAIVPRFVLVLPEGEA